MSATGLRFSVIWVRKASNLVWQIFQFIKLVKDIKYRVFKNESQKKLRRHLKQLWSLELTLATKSFPSKWKKLGKERALKISQEEIKEWKYQIFFTKLKQWKGNSFITLKNKKKIAEPAYHQVYKFH